MAVASYPYTNRSSGDVSTLGLPTISANCRRIGSARLIEMDDARPETLRKLEDYGEQLGAKILNDRFERAEAEVEVLE